MNTLAPLHAALDRWIAEHADEQLAFLQALVRQPTDTPPGDNAPHAELTARLLAQMGLHAQAYPVPAEAVRARGLVSLTNLIVRRGFGAAATGSGSGSEPASDPASHPDPTVALNAHGDAVPPGEGWTQDPYGAAVVDGPHGRCLYGRAAAVSKSDFATYTYALRALLALADAQPQLALRGTVELHFTYDEELGGELGPGWLLDQGLTRPHWLIAAGFSHQVVNAHNGCLQLQLTVHGRMAHAAYPDSGVDALQGAVAILNALYARNAQYRQDGPHSQVPGIRHPYINVGRIEGGTHTNVVPGQVQLKLDRRMIPEEDPAQVEAELRQLIAAAAAAQPGITVSLQRLLLAHSLRPAPGRCALVEALQRHAQAVFGEAIPVVGTPLYTDVRLYGAAGVRAAIYGAGPHTVLESGAKRADEHLRLDDLYGATRVVARSVLDLLLPAG